MPITRSRHKVHVGRGYHGRHPRRLWLTIEQAWDTGIAISSNYAREHAAIIALAASLGWISNVTVSGRQFARYWNITAEGVTALMNRREMRA